MMNLIDLLQNHDSIRVVIGHKDWAVYSDEVDDDVLIASCGYNQQPEYRYDELMPALVNYLVNVRRGPVSRCIEVITV